MYVRHHDFFLGAFDIAKAIAEIVEHLVVGSEIHVHDVRSAAAEYADILVYDGMILDIDNIVSFSENFRDSRHIMISRDESYDVIDVQNHAIIYKNVGIFG